MQQAGNGEREDRHGRAYHNLIEPQSLVSLFLRCPPHGFSALEIGGETPAFVTDFDLATTMEPGPRRGSMASILRWFASRFLRLRTCFVGTTVTEYALLPPGQPAAIFVDQLLLQATDCRLLIIKDIPSAPVLVNEAAMHYNGELFEACQRAGFFMVEGQALAYVPMDFGSIENFLGRMTRTTRKEIRRKLRSAGQLNIQTIATGAERYADEAVLGEFYTLYLNVYEQSDIHFDLLSPDFFRALLQDAASGGVVFEYRAAGKLIGYNLCFEQGGMLLDKYVGFSYPQAREFNLYCVSWFHNLEYALSRGLKCYVAGWTDPEIKRHLGASFTFTRHAVFIRNPWLRRLLSHFKHHFEADSQWRQQTR